MLGQQSVQKQFNIVIQEVSFINHTKTLTDVAKYLIRKLLLKQFMELYFSKVKVKHLTILAKLTILIFDEIYFGALSTFVMVNLVNDVSFANHYNRNFLKILLFNVKRITICSMKYKRSDITTPVIIQRNKIKNILRCCLICK